jgi:hypothetical protein
MPALQQLPTRSIPLASEVVETLAAVVRALAFWVAIALTAAYPVAFLLPEASLPQVITGLVFVHAFSLLLGHGHATR